MENNRKKEVTICPVCKTERPYCGEEELSVEGELNSFIVNTFHGHKVELYLCDVCGILFKKVEVSNG